jgi:hypothetical protein
MNWASRSNPTQLIQALFWSNKILIRATKRLRTCTIFISCKKTILILTKKSGTFLAIAISMKILVSQISQL